MKLKQLAIIAILLVIGVLAYFALKPQGSEIKKEINGDLANAATNTNDEGPKQSENNTATNGILPALIILKKK